MFQGAGCLFVTRPKTAAAAGLSVTTQGSNVATAIAGNSQTFTSIVNIPDTTGITIVGLSIGNHAGDGVEPSVVTLGGATVTKLVGGNNLGTQYNNSGFGNVWLGQVLNSLIGSTGLKDLAITLNESAGGNSDLAGGCVCFVDQNAGTPLGTAVDHSGGSGTMSVGVTDSVTGDIVVDVVGSFSTINSSTQTQKWVQDSSAANGSQSTAAGASGTVTMAYDIADDGAIAAVAVKA